MTKTIHCTACGNPRPEGVVGHGISQSRFVDWQICSNCGTREAFEGFFWQDKYRAVKPRALTNPQGFAPGENLFFLHCDGALPCHILEINATETMARVTIEGWIGRHWYPLSKLRRTPQPTGAR